MASRIASCPHLPTTLTTSSDVDLVVFVVQVPSDFPDMPRLARLLDRVPRERRVVVDLWGRFNDTIRVDHDFNHLEKLDGHPGVGVGARPCGARRPRSCNRRLQPRRADVGSFLFHGFDPARGRGAARIGGGCGARVAVGRPRREALRRRLRRQQLAALDAGAARSSRAIAQVAARVGQACLAGWDWAERPDWAVEIGLSGDRHRSRAARRPARRGPHGRALRPRRRRCSGKAASRRSSIARCSASSAS